METVVADSDEVETMTEDESETVQKSIHENEDSQEVKSNRTPKIRINTGDRIRASTEVIMERNKITNQLLEEIKISESQRAAMEKQISHLSRKLEESTILIERTNLDYSQLTKSLRESEQIIEDLKEEKESLLLRIHNYDRHNQSRIANEDQIIAAVNQRVEEWKAVFVAKDSAILQLQNEVMKLKQSLAVSSSLNSKSSVAVLSKAVQEKDVELKNLKLELEQATEELEKSAAVIENLNTAQNLPKDNDWQKKQINNLRKKLATFEAREGDLKNKVNDAESSLAKCEKALTEALARLNIYESGEYGLTDAVQEIKDYQFQLQIRDRQIEELTLIVGQLEMGLFNLKEENDTLKVKLGLEVKNQNLEEILKDLKSKNHEYTNKNLNKNKKDNFSSNFKAITEKDTQSAKFLKEMAEQVQLLHSEFSNLLKTTNKFKTSSVFSGSFDENEKYVEQISKSVVKCDEKPVLLSNELTGSDENVAVMKSKLKLYEDEIGNNAQYVAKLENDLANAVAKIEKLEAKLTSETNEAQSPQAKLDAQLAFHLKEIYQETADEWQNENYECLKEEITKLRLENEIIAFNKLEFDTLNEQHMALIATLKGSDEAIKVELAEMCRKLTVSNVNERKLMKKCSFLMEEVNFQKKQNINLYNEISTISNSTINRLGYLESFKQMALYKISALHRSLEGTVSSSDMDLLEKQFNDLLSRQNVTFSNEISVSGKNKYQFAEEMFQPDIKEIRSEMENVKTENTMLINENLRLKVTNEVFENQVKSLQALNLSKTIELDNLRIQMKESQGEQNERELIKKLYLQILHLQMSESNLQNKLEKCQAQIQKIELLSLRLEQRCDEKDLMFHRYCWQIIQLRKIIRQLRREELEKKGEFVLATLKLKDDQFQLEKSLQVARKEEHEVNLLKVEVETKSNALNEFLTMKTDNNMAENIEKFYKITELRIQNNKKSHQVGWLTQELETKEAIMRQHQSRIAFLEEQLVRAKTEEWEREIFINKQTDFEITKRFEGEHEAVKLSDTSEMMPDERLNIALQDLKEKSVFLSEKQNEIKGLVKREKDAMKRNEELEMLLHARDQVIEELKLLKTNTNVADREIISQREDQPNVAFAVVEVLKARLNQKEETIAKYQEMMENVKKEMQEMVENHGKELEIVGRHSSNIELNVEVENKSDEEKPIENSALQISKMNELQEITIQQDNAIIILADKLKASSKEIQKLYLKIETMEKEFAKEKEKVIEEYESTIKAVENDKEKCVLDSKQLMEDLHKIKGKLEEQIITNKSSPTATMKNMIEDLKSQLRAKDKESQSLSRVVVSLNNKMKLMVEENTCRSQHNQHLESQCQQCPIIQKELDVTKAEFTSLKRKLKSQEQSLQHLKEVEEKLDRQTGLCSKLQSEKLKNQQLVQSLEKKLNSASVANKPMQKTIETTSEPQSQKLIEKLNAELVHLSKHNANLQKQLDKLKSDATKQTPNPPKKQKPETSLVTKSTVEDPEFKSKIKYLIDEVDRLTKLVKTATSSSQRSNDVVLEDFDALIKHEGELRNEIAKLQEENRQLKAEIERNKSKGTAADLLRENNKWLRNLLDDSAEGHVPIPEAITSKIIEYNERLLKDYQKEVKTNERQRIQLYLLKAENEKKQKQIDEYQKLLQKKQTRQ